MTGDLKDSMKIDVRVIKSPLNSDGSWIISPERSPDRLDIATIPLQKALGDQAACMVTEYDSGYRIFITRRGTFDQPVNNDPEWQAYLADLLKPRFTADGSADAIQVYGPNNEHVRTDVTGWIEESGMIPTSPDLLDGIIEVQKWSFVKDPVTGLHTRVELTLAEPCRDKRRLNMIVKDVFRRIGIHLNADDKMNVVRGITYEQVFTHTIR